MKPEDTKMWIPLAERDNAAWQEKITSLMQELVISMARLQREINQLQHWKEEVDRERSRFPEMEWDEGA